MRAASGFGDDLTGKKGLNVSGWCAWLFPPDANRNGRSQNMRMRVGPGIHGHKLEVPPTSSENGNFQKYGGISLKSDPNPLEFYYIG